MTNTQYPPKIKDLPPWKEPEPLESLNINYSVCDVVTKTEITIYGSIDDLNYRQLLEAFKECLDYCLTNYGDSSMLDKLVKVLNLTVVYKDGLYK